MIDFVFPFFLAGVWLLLSWPYARLMGGGQPLNPIQKKIIGYGFLFVLGAGYCMLIGHVVHWPVSSWIMMMGGWGVVLVVVAWMRYRRKRDGALREGS